MSLFSPTVVSRYPHTEIGTRFFLNLRFRLTPYDQMDQELPQSGRIADLGCGHGLFSLLLAERNPHRQVFALDHDTHRIQAARKAAKDLPNLTFEQGALLPLPDSANGPFEGIAAIDVMHYFDPPSQEKILSDLFLRLAPGGTLIFREVDPEGGAASKLNRLYERLATATGFTQTAKTQQSLYFRKPQQWLQLLESLGFQARAERCSHFLFADVLYIAKKSEPSGQKMGTGK